MVHEIRRLQRNYRTQMGLLGSSHSFFAFMLPARFHYSQIFPLFLLPSLQFTVRASTTRRRKEKSSQFSYCGLDVYVRACVYVWAELQNLIFVLSREMLFFFFLPYLLPEKRVKVSFSFAFFFHRRTHSLGFVVRFLSARRKKEKTM